MHQVLPSISSGSTSSFSCWPLPWIPLPWPSWLCWSTEWLSDWSYLSSAVGNWWLVRRPNHHIEVTATDKTDQTSKLHFSSIFKNNTEPYVAWLKKAFSKAQLLRTVIYISTSNTQVHHLIDESNILYHAGNTWINPHPVIHPNSFLQLEAKSN